MTRQRKCIIYPEDLALHKSNAFYLDLFEFSNVVLVLEDSEEQLFIKLLYSQTWHQLIKVRCSLAERKRAVKASPIEATEIDMKNGFIIRGQNVDANNLCLIRKKRNTIA